MTTEQIWLVSILGGLFLIGFASGLVRLIKQRKKRAEEATREVEGVDIRHGVRYSENLTTTDELGNINVSFGKGDVVLKRGVTHKVHKGDYVKPGKYTILATNEKEETFNIRVGTYVQEYKHNQQIILAEGDEITSVSTNVILR